MIREKKIIYLQRVKLSYRIDLFTSSASEISVVLHYKIHHVEIFVIPISVAMFLQLIENAFYPLDSLALWFLLREMKQVARNRVDFGLVAVPVRHSQIRDFLHFVEERLEIALNFERIFRKLEFSRNISQNRKIPV